MESQFEVGDIIVHKAFHWYGFIMNVEPLDLLDTKGEYLYKCYRFDCGGDTFNEIEPTLSKLFRRVNE